jgi:hypothetical protein
LSVQIAIAMSKESVSRIPENSRRALLARLAVLAVGGYVAPKVVRIKQAFGGHACGKGQGNPSHTCI